MMSEVDQIKFEGQNIEIPEEITNAITVESKAISRDKVKAEVANEAKKRAKELEEADVKVEKEQLTEVIKSMQLQTPEQIAEFVFESKKAAINMKFEGTILMLWLDIKRIRVIEGILRNDKMICEIYIKDKVLTIPLEKLDTPKAFKDQYAREFKEFLFIKNNSWQELINALLKNKIEVVKDSEESEHVRIAREVWSRICELGISEDPNTFKTSGKSVLKYNNQYFIRSSTIEKIVKDKFYVIRISDLSSTMTELGMKKPGAIKKHEKRCWELIGSEFTKEKDPILGC
jgi:hypothetical protein